MNPKVFDLVQGDCLVLRGTFVRRFVALKIQIDEYKMFILQYQPLCYNELVFKRSLEPWLYLWVGPEGAEVDLSCRNSPSGVDLRRAGYRSGSGKPRRPLCGPQQSCLVESMQLITVARVAYSHVECKCKRKADLAVKNPTNKY